MNNRSWQDEDSEMNFFAHDSPSPIEEQVAQGAKVIRTLQQKLSNTSYNVVDWEYLSQFLDLENHPNYKAVTSPSIRSIGEAEMEFEDFDLNSLPAQIPTMSYPNQPINQEL